MSSYVWNVDHRDVLFHCCIPLSLKYIVLHSMEMVTVHVSLSLLALFLARVLSSASQKQRWTPIFYRNFKFCAYWLQARQWTASIFFCNSSWNSPYKRCVGNLFNAMGFSCSVVCPLSASLYTIHSDINCSTSNVFDLIQSRASSNVTNEKHCRFNEA